MTVKKGKGSTTAKTQQADKGVKAYNAAYAAFENAVMTRLNSAGDPFSAGIKMAAQIRKLADKVESEVGAEATSMTEAGYAAPGIVGVGV
jgi:hypothetical protein